MNVPVFDGARIVLVAGVGNKVEEYDQDDAQNLTLMMQGVWRLLVRKRAEEAIRESEERYDAVFRGAAEGILVADLETKRFIYANPSICRMLGYSEEEMKHLGVQDIHPAESLEHVLGEFEAQARGEKSLAAELPCQRKDGSVIYADITASGVVLNNKRCNVGFFSDITERKQAEEEKAKLEGQLHQAQKMETVGQLAGGVAHDFNNMLQVIISYVEMSLAKVEAGLPLHKYLLEIRRAAHRSAEITGQLLAFARKQTVSPKVLDINDAVSGTQKMIQRMIGEDIDLAWMPEHDLWKVKIDPAQLDQILANLAVNARDAIGGVGKLTIGTEKVTIDAVYCATHVGFVPGEYVLLAVSDNGCGMDKETMSHLFEPFFTTKEPGKGTGLGLSTIYGIVKQNNGFINVYSEPGVGTTFKVYLPRAEGATATGRVEAEVAAPRGGTETVLVVEDEAAILELARESLEELGYTVLTAKSPEEAMRRGEEQAGPIQLLITDVVMPQMNGRQLAERLGAVRSGLKCLYMSGYTADVIAHRGVLDEGVSFIAKPFSLTTLAEKVREVLDG
jgi:PAS domain S-box-containing protein